MATSTSQNLFAENFSALRQGHAVNYARLGICFRESIFDAIHGKTGSSSQLFTWLYTDKLAGRTYAPAIRAINYLLGENAKVEKADMDENYFFFLSIKNEEGLRASLPAIKNACKAFLQFCTDFLAVPAEKKVQTFDAVKAIERLATRCQKTGNDNYARELLAIIGK